MQKINDDFIKIFIPRENYKMKNWPWPIMTSTKSLYLTNLTILFKSIILNNRPKQINAFVFLSRNTTLIFTKNI